MNVSQPNIIVSELDLHRLEHILDGLTPVEVERTSYLEAELDRADIVEPTAIPPNELHR